MIFGKDKKCELESEIKAHILSRVHWPDLLQHQNKQKAVPTFNLQTSCLTLTVLGDKYSVCILSSGGLQLNPGYQICNVSLCVVASFDKYTMRLGGVLTITWT